MQFSRKMELVKLVHQHGFAGLSVSRSLVYLQVVFWGQALFLLAYFYI